MRSTLLPVVAAGVLAAVTACTGATADSGDGKVNIEASAVVGEAYKMVKNVNWTNEDHNAVAPDILKNQMRPLEAAEKWALSNKQVWNKWIL